MQDVLCVTSPLSAKIGDLVIIKPTREVCAENDKKIGWVNTLQERVEEAWAEAEENEFIVGHECLNKIFKRGGSERFDYTTDLDGNIIGRVVETNNSYGLVHIGDLDCEEDVEEDHSAINEDYLDDVYIPINVMGTEMEEREEKSMNNLFDGFGRTSDYRLKLSLNGIAVRQSNGNYVVFNKETREFVDCTKMLLDIKDGIFVLPAVEVKAGDTIIHEDKIYFVVDTTNEIKAVSYEDCTQTVLVPKTTMFGVKYFKKVCSLFGDNFTNNKDLFKNPMVLMALINGDKDTDISKLMLLSSLGNTDLASNPLLLSVLMKDGKSDLATLAMMSALNGNNIFGAKATKKDKEA